MEGYVEVLYKGRYDAIRAELLASRLSQFIREKEAQEGPEKGLIFPFVRGLRFAALLIYAIREALSESSLEVNWGQIIDADGNNCSPEGDIVIHKKGYKRRWNGGDGPNHIMDFRFIAKERAVAVISCKSFLTTSGVEKEYCSRMLKYCNKVWLFAECCGPESAELIRTEATGAGYGHFWHLYTWSRTTEEVFPVQDWNDFVRTLMKLSEDYR